MYLIRWITPVLPINYYNKFYFCLTECIYIVKRKTVGNCIYIYIYISAIIILSIYLNKAKTYHCTMHTSKKKRKIIYTSGNNVFAFHV